MDGSSGSGQIYREPWIFLESMSFLKQSIAPRRTLDNADSPQLAEHAHNLDDTMTTVTRRSKRSKDDEVVSKLDDVAKRLQCVVTSLEDPVVEPSVDAAQLKAMELLMKDLPQHYKDELFKDMYFKIMELRERARIEVSELAITH